MKAFLIFCAIFVPHIMASIPGPRVLISTGVIEGRTYKNDINGKEYFAFQSIPYARPPVGNLRFEPPRKPKKFKGILETKADRPDCISGASPPPAGIEDCLYLNVYTNELDPSEFKPVMVWLHGGRFATGGIEKAWNGPDYLLAEDVVVVAPKYRLFAFGFLSTRDPAAEGNAGLKDQVAALQWVQENIHNFGGDPNLVTILGCSAGSASVHYHTLSPLSRGLFHRAIMESGVSINEWAFQPSPVKRAFQLGRVLGIDTNDTIELIQELKTVSAEDLVNASNSWEKMGTPDEKSVFPFAPSVERDHPGAFITNSPYQLLKNGEMADVPYIIGYSKDEGHMLTVVDSTPQKLVFGFMNKMSEQIYQIRKLTPFMRPTKKFQYRHFDIIDTVTEYKFVSDAQQKIYAKDHKFFVPHSMNIRNTTVSKKVGEEILKFFFKDRNVSNHEEFLQYVSQYMFVKGIRRVADLMKNQRKIYFYKFIYEGRGHGSEKHFILKNDAIDFKKEEYEVSKKMVKMWTNFARTGNPTPEPDPLLNDLKWLKASNEPGTGIAYLEICDKLTMKKNPEQEYFDFWLELFKKYGKPPFYAF